MSVQQWSPDEYEEISGEEVDRVVAALEQLMGSVESENVRGYLEEALDNIHGLFYGDDTTGESLSRAA